jgi:ABC-type oligopeptide transport system substrate-binding subunit
MRSTIKNNFRRKQKMKKITAVLACAAASAMLLCACGSSDAGTDNSTADTTSAGTETTGTEGQTAASSDVTGTPDGYYISLNGVLVYANAEMAPIAQELGEPASYFESESCAFQGLDKTYTYGSVVISTYPVDDVDYVYTIELKDDTVETEEGICIGSSKDDVTAAYGTATSETETALTYEKDDCVLAFIFDGDSVANITYTAITE